ncbi:MAG: hypothetical protein P8M11_09010 [Planctomycetota bacterium]|nr:hypothetical protein [Planctomycetota bacterium]
MLSLLLLSLAQAPAPCLPSEILPASGTTSPSFGEIMAVDGDRLMVAADSGGGSLDTIKVFERDAVGGGWLEVQEVALALIQADRLVDLDLDGDRPGAGAAEPAVRSRWPRRSPADPPRGDLVLPILVL